MWYDLTWDEEICLSTYVIEMELPEDLLLKMLKEYPILEYMMEVLDLKLEL